MSDDPARPELRDLWRTGPVWTASDRPLARYVGRPVAGFLRVEAAGGIVLLLAAVVALVWANSPLAGSYDALWTTDLRLSVGGLDVAEDLRHWVNDGLMVIFFFVVGLEIKYEMVSGELRDPRSASVPIVAALGGMVLPALLYLLFNPTGAASAGWGIPMATDIAFAVGVLSVLGSRVPSSARVFLLTLAIVDDIGAILVIAVFYTEGLSLGWLAVAAVGLLVMVALRAVRVWSILPYLAAGVVVWFATYESGVHATIAGVVIGLLTPALPLLKEGQAREHARRLSTEHDLDTEQLSRYRFLLGESVPVADRLGARLHPWSSYVVLPVFALANAGIPLGGDLVGDAVTSSVAVGIAAGLVVGKPAGILLAAWVAVRLRLGRLPEDTGWPMVVGLGMVAGVGFTVSLFITGLAFPAETAGLVAEAKVGILVASVLAAVLAAAVLVLSTRKQPGEAGR